MAEPTPDVRRAFGQRVRELRQARGISQEALAHLAGVHRTYLGSVERGERNVALENIHAIADALGMPVKHLFDDTTGGTAPSTGSPPAGHS